MLRQAAREAHARGEMARAIGLQTRVVNATPPDAATNADDVLFLCLLLHGTGRVAEGTSLLRDTLSRFPGNPALHENLAVLLLAADDPKGAISACETALALGAVSPNLHDCLCDAYSRTGRQDLAIEAGRRALEAKDLIFGAGRPIAAIPAASPPAFDMTNPDENVIAYCLWGDQPRYQVPLLENARILPHLFPGWTIRVYHDTGAAPEYLTALASHGVQLCPMALPAGVPAHRRLLWRFAVIADPGVKRFLIRDADSLLSVKERVAVDAWINSPFHFHAMRDWYTHTDLLLAGMWGGSGGILPAPETLMMNFKGWRVENDHIDQDVLSEMVWPIVRHDILVHDSVFTGCLGSVPFPPFGALPPGSHIGQNAFRWFSPGR